jgi:hypothetical protein
VPLFCVSFALDSSSAIQVTQIECLDVTEVYQHMTKRFPVIYENMIISAIVEFRHGGDAHGKVGD